jgi:chemotaxis protein histidine kinase CheA
MRRWTSVIADAAISRPNRPSGATITKHNGRGEFLMSLHNLRMFALLILAFSISSYAQSPTQSLGDLARQLRADRQTNGPSHARVFTNDDLDSPKPVPAPSSSDATLEDSPKNLEDLPKNGEAVTAQAPTSAEDAKKGTSQEVGEPKPAKSSKPTKKDPAKEREAQELETQTRTSEINRIYLDRIAALRQQLGTAQVELAKLQQLQLDSTYAFQRTLGVSPFPGEYEQQQRTFNEKIEAQRNLIAALNSQLEDAYEAARHAGVPHASD